MKYLLKSYNDADAMVLNFDNTMNDICTGIYIHKYYDELLRLRYEENFTLK